MRREGEWMVALGVRAMTIEDLLVWADRRSLTAVPEADALAETDALLEAALLAVRFDATALSAWLLFDCRGAVHLEMGNTAVVAVHGVTGLQWRTEPRSTRTWWAVLGWRPTRATGSVSYSADLSPGGYFQVEGTAAEFYVGNIPGGDEPPPDFTSATGEEIRAGPEFFKVNEASTR